MNVEVMTRYRANMFDGEPGMDWLRPGWRALRLYAARARAAINAGNLPRKAEMIDRADRLLTLLAGLLDTGPGTTLGPKLTTIYTSLGLALLRANLHDDTAALDMFDDALALLDRDLRGRSAAP